MIQVNFPIYSRKNPIIWNRICGNRVSGNHVCGNCVMLGLLSCTNFGSWCRVILKLQFITTILFSSSNTQFWEYFVCLLFEYFFQIKFLNWYQNTPKNAKVTRYVKKKKHTLQHLKLGKLKIGIHKIGCLMSWTRYTTSICLTTKANFPRKTFWLKPR